MTKQVRTQEEPFEHAGTIRHLIHMNSAGFHGLILAGAGGVEKSRFVRGVLHDALGKDFNNVVSLQEHHKIKVAELISTLEDHAASEKLIVFDDMDRMFDDCEMEEILSAALENERQRKITVRPKKEHPYQSGFNAKIIVITNEA
jgi:hypothetical protein